MLENFEFRLRTRVQQESPEAILLSYLNSKDTIYPPKDMVMIALMSYWLPLAYQAAGKGTKDNLDYNIRSCIYRLKLHQQYLQEMLGEEPADLEVGLIESQSPTSPVNKPSEIQPQQQALFIQADDNLLDVPSPVENDLSVKQQPEPQEWFNPLKPRS
ncbi:hypothetical protein H6G97_20835 [Nostoc flagelliforme FACHB-838]|uniref:Uncharacterized protein n=1 Tax=Nostoc flagelliforme FACHB-838 TaxID=2692904 RepID=A0ABR8DST3_9NOSO|nr:hypothetical protein [Nostoc flagelliforme]MBD2531897.1 hypothetical protein [Nostoc flagelliforme FACHB-838]